MISATHGKSRPARCMRPLRVSLLAAALFCFAHPIAVHAQAEAKAEAVRSFDIPSQPLAAALSEFARQSGKELLFAPDIAARKTSSRVQGMLSPLEALDALLRNTGIGFSTTPNGAILLRESGSNASTREEGLREDPENTRDLDRIVVTGSRIKRATVEGPAPVTVISRAQMEREGFTTAYEALYTLTQATGSGLQTQFSPNGATANATEIDLRGLGPGRTLLLINGRRATDYPLPFNGLSNIVNLSSIPVAAIERIEVLASGASAIYGSDAVAGVVNFVLRESFEGTQVTARIGTTPEGGGDSHRLDLVGGFERGALRGMYALEYLHRKPIYARDRHNFDSNLDIPGGNVPQPDLVYGIARVLPLFGLDSGPAYPDPGAACGNFGPDVASLPYLGLGTICGNYDLQAQRTIRNEVRDKSGFFNATFDFDNGVQLFGTAMLWKSSSEFHTQASTGSLFQPLVFDVGPDAANDLGMGGEFIGPTRIFQLGENPRPDQLYDETAWDAVFGLRGNLAGRFDWEVAYHHSGYDVSRDQRVLLAQPLNDHYLGPQLGAISLFGIPFAIHEVRRDRLGTALTPEQYDALSTLNRTTADSANDQIQAQVTGDLFRMPAGPARFAGILEWGSQDYRIHLDPRLNSGLFHGVVSEVPGGGERDRYAAGIEFAFPLLETLRLTAAGRYDKYDDITDVDGAFTYNLGLEFRPVESLLLRASYATSFRAPDMHFIFAGANVGQVSPIDQLRCRRDQQVTDLSQCTLQPFIVLNRREGNPGLEEEKGKSWTLGAVWSPSRGFDISLDYYDIRLDNMVNDLSTDFVLRTEADCALGRTITGEPVDTGTRLCEFARQSIVRDANGFLSVVNTGPINRAMQSIRGVDGSLNYRVETDGLGRFAFNLGWSHVLEQKRQEFAADPVDSYRDDPENLDLRSQVRGGVSWQAGRWTNSLFGFRRGSRPRYDGQGRTGSHTTYNYSVSYQASAALRVSLIVDDVLNQDPKIDSSFTAYPFFYQSNVNPIGREVFLEASYKF